MIATGDFCIRNPVCASASWPENFIAVQADVSRRVVTLQAEAKRFATRHDVSLEERLRILTDRQARN